MIEEKEAKEFILADAKRLIEEEHILDLVKNQRYEEVKKLECTLSYDVSKYMYDECRFDGYHLYLEEQEIPDGAHFPIAYWIITIGWGCVIDPKDTDEFAAKLAEEAGKLGKSIAYKMMNRCTLENIDYNEFFDDTDAEKYDAEFGHTA